MKHLLFILLATTIIIISNSCGENITEPQPGRRDYVWSVDTIKIPMNYLNRLWGASPNDIWATGPGGGLDQTIWRFDGTKWKTDGISRAISPTAIFGFNPYDVWFGGYSGMIWRFDGNKFFESLFFYPNPNWSYSAFKDLYGTSPNDFYAIAYVDSNQVKYGKIFHYNGKSWKITNVSSRGDIFMQIRKGKNDSNYYLWSVRSNGINSDSVKIFSFNGSSLNELYRGLMNDYHGAGIETINGKVYFGIDNSVYTIENGSFKKEFDVNNPQFIQGLNGRNENDIFLWMWDGVAHYNGQNVEYIYKTHVKQTPRDLIVFENQIVILFDDVSKGLSLVVRGKIK